VICYTLEVTIRVFQIDFTENRLRIPIFVTATRRVYSNEKALKIAAFAIRGDVASARDREPARPKRIDRPRRGLNDISVLSKACDASSLSRNKAAIWRISAKAYLAMDSLVRGIISLLPTVPWVGGHRL
jgi:hypothetical protein